MCSCVQLCTSTPVHYEQTLRTPCEARGEGAASEQLSTAVYEYTGTL